MDPSLVSAGVGLLSSIFGGQSTPDYVRRNYDLQNQLYQKALQNYDNYDPAAQDQKVIDSYSGAANSRAMALLKNYDSMAAGAGSAIGQSDTAKDRARTQIASDAATKAQDLAANLYSTEAQRKASMLNGATTNAPSSNSAMYLDNQTSQNNQSTLQGLADAARLISGLLGGSKKSTSLNDVYNGSVGYNGLSSYGGYA